MQPPAYFIQIAYTWDGIKIPELETAAITFRIDHSGLHVAIQARFHGDKTPAALPGPTDRLWEYEVVELFLSGDDDRYLEIEFGPHGHFLVLQLAGIRNVTKKLLPMAYATQITGSCWQATAHLPLSSLPTNPNRINAYAIHGSGKDRRYLAAFPVPGYKPDFHQPQFFRPIAGLATTTSV
ncbi:MAG: hypothetical protein A2511_05580 [Deltaproteobacteria bacterium RIFOXYD12_FULL_50_9]|nr:MAG: hypothetical protein A2511_05580 [Deltaproteobacteria bacterium RIFOXYD12_FULL_50_9]